MMDPEEEEEEAEVDENMLVCEKCRVFTTANVEEWIEHWEHCEGGAEKKASYFKMEKDETTDPVYGIQPNLMTGGFAKRE